MSSSSLAASACIERHLGLLDRLAAIGVANGAAVHKINRAAEEVLQDEQQPDVLEGSIHPHRIGEFDQQVDITGSLIKVLPQGGAEELQPPDAKPPTQIIENVDVPLVANQINHDEHYITRKRRDHVVVTGPFSGLSPCPAFS